MEAYKRLVRRNRDVVHSLESLANGVTWLIPERFSESEIVPEAVTSFLGVITAINQHILDTTPKFAQPETSSFPFSLCITLLKDLETLVEVGAQHFYGDEKKWNFIAITEAIKVSLRLAMLKNNGYKMLLHGGETKNDGSDPDAVDSQSNGISGLLKNNQAQNPWEGRAMSALSRFGQNARSVNEPTWLRRVNQQQAIIEPPSTVAKTTSLSTFLSEKGVPGGLFLTGEVMFILRPLIYVLMIRKYGVRSWFPWVTSLAVDLIGNGIISLVTSLPEKNKGFNLSNLEKSELKRRKVLWALYLMRDPFFTKYTRQRLDNASKVVEPVPIVGIIAEKFVELLVGAQTRYTYMSGS